MRKFFGIGSSKPSSSSSSAPSAPASRPSLVGRWKEPAGKDTTEFHADGSVTEKPSAGENIGGRYTLDGSKLKIRLAGGSDDLSFTAVVKGDTLEMTGPDGQTTRYERVS